MRQTFVGRQRGMTLISWVLVLLVLGFFVLLGLKLVPIYIDHYNVRMAVEGVANEPGARERSQRSLYGKIQSRLNLNYVTDLPRNAIRIIRDVDERAIEVNYEKRENIVANVDVLVTFKEKYELK